MYKTARRQTIENPKYIELIPNLFTTLKKYQISQGSSFWVVNGALEYLSKDLEIAENIALQGGVVSIGASLFLFQQLAGINAIVYYSTPVFRNVGIASDVTASGLVGASNVFGTTISSSLMDKQGRKSLLITSFARME